MSTTPNPNKRSVVHKEMLPGEGRKIAELFGRAMEKKLITWVRIEKDPLTIHEFASLLDELTANDSLNETGAKTDVD